MFYSQLVIVHAVFSLSRGNCCLLKLCGSRQQARTVTMTTLGVATTRYRHTERKLSGRQKKQKQKKTKYLPVLT